MNHYVIYTGPMLTKTIAKRLGEHEDITVTVGDTANVHIATPYSQEYILGLLPSGWTHRDILQLP